jgi:hypothetical protein
MRHIVAANFNVCSKVFPPCRTQVGSLDGHQGRSCSRTGGAARNFRCRNSRRPWQGIFRIEGRILRRVPSANYLHPTYARQNILRTMPQTGKKWWLRDGLALCVSATDDIVWCVWGLMCVGSDMCGFWNVWGLMCVDLVSVSLDVRRMWCAWGLMCVGSDACGTWCTSVRSVWGLMFKICEIIMNEN